MYTSRISTTLISTEPRANGYFEKTQPKRNEREKSEKLFCEACE